MDNYFEYRRTAPPGSFFLPVIGMGNTPEFGEVLKWETLFDGWIHVVCVNSEMGHLVNIDSFVNGKYKITGIERLGVLESEEEDIVNE